MKYANFNSFKKIDFKFVLLIFVTPLLHFLAKLNFLKILHHQKVLHKTLKQIAFEKREKLVQKR